MTQAATAAVRKQIVVPASQQRAFEVFTAGFGDFKPREHNIMASPIARTVFEPRVGGHIVDVGGLHPVRQTRLADPEIGRDLLDVLSGRTVASDVHDVVAELLGVGLGHDQHPSSGTSRHHRSDVTYSCSSPRRAG